MISVPPSSPAGNCSRCSVPLSSGTDDGMCTRCLLKGALESLSDYDEADDERSSSATLLRERQIGGYHLLGEIGRGGMGVVFKARQLHPARMVALKVIAAGELASPVAVQRFHNEAQAAARLEHPNIVPIYEVGEDRGWHFFSMQLVEGRTLADLIRAGRPEPAAAVALLVQVARAVEHAHQRGILHRDLKPTNILLDERGEPHLTDFGLAKVLEQDSDLTHSGAILGTPAYMSPELAAGRSSEITTATDVYGLGAMFYELLSGRPPFRAESTSALLRQIAEEEPAELRAEGGKQKTEGEQAVRVSAFFIPPSAFADLSVICLKCLEKEPAKRYATAGELADELERWQRHEPIRARPAGTLERSVKWVRRHRARAALFTSVGLSGLALTLVSLTFNVRLDRARKAAEQNAARRHDQLLREHQREAGRATAAGDALNGLFALTEALRLEQGNQSSETALRRRLGLTLRSSPELLRLWDAQGAAVQLQFTPDNRSLVAVMRDGGLRNWDLVSGATTVTSATDQDGVIASVLSPDGSQILESLRAAPYARVRRWDNGTNTALPLRGPCDRAIVFDGSGRLLATGGGRLRLWDARSLEEIPLPDLLAVPCARLVLSRDDRRLLAIATDGKARLLDLATRRWLEMESIVVPPEMPAPCFSDDGHWLLLLTGTEAVLLDAATGHREFAAPHSGLVFESGFSPDARFFSVASFRDQARVWSLPSEQTGTNVTAFRLPVRHESGANHARFSPDGRLFATTGFDYQLRLHHAGRHQLVSPLLHHTALVESLAFSADGRFLASADAKGLVRVWDLMPRGLTALVGAAAKPNPLFSPDGRQIVARDLQDRLRVFDTRADQGSGEVLFQPAGANADTRQDVSTGAMAARGAPTDLAWDSSGRFLAAAVGTNGARVWDFRSRRLVAAMTNAGTALSVTFGPGGSMLVIGTESGGVLRWDLATGRQVPPLLAGQFPVTALAWSRYGRWLAAGGERAVQVWDAGTGIPLGGAVPVNDILSALEFAPDGRHLLVGAGNTAIEPGSAWQLELPSLRSLLPPMSHGDGVAIAAYSHEGKWVASGGEDNVVRLWHASDGSAAGPEMRHAGIVNTLQFDPTDHWLAAGGNDGFLRVWSVPAGELCGPALPFGLSTPSVAFSPTGDRIFAGTHAENSWLVSFAPDQRALDEIERIARGQTALQRGPSGALEQVPPATLAREFAIQLPAGGVFTNAAAAAAWHESLAQPAEAAGAWFSAEFHLRHLAAWRPDDTNLLHRAEQARTQRAGPPR